MEEKLINALNEMEGKNFQSLQEAMTQFSLAELLDVWLKYEGICGYTNQIIEAFEALGIDVDEMYN